MCEKKYRKQAAKRIISFAAAFCMAILLPVSAGALAEKEQANSLTRLPSGLNAAELEEKIDAYVKENEETMAAMSVAVFTAKDSLLEKAYGYTDKENSLAATEESVYEWGSCTKLIIWSCVMQLKEQGKLDLNADVRTYLPEGFFKKLKYDAPISMMNLMNHNAGWQESFADIFIEDAKDVMSLEASLRYMEPEQIYEPGTKLAYSNWGSALAAYIVECVSGEDFSAYVHEHIFSPLGMEHTAISADLSDCEWVKKQRMLENCYAEDGSSLGTCFYHIPLYPAGMATGTISDFVKFAQAFIPGGEENSPLFEKRETLDEMLSPSLYFADGRTARNCHGFWTDEYSVSLLWHNGGTAGSSSWFAFDPASKTGAVILTNQSAESVYTCGILPMVFGEYEYTPLRDTEDISGIYMAMRTCLRGVAKPYSLMSRMYIAANKDGQYGMNGMKLVKIGEKQYLMDMSGKQYVFFVTQDVDGANVLQLPGSDYVQTSMESFLAQIASLILFALASIYSLVMLIISLVRVIARRQKPFKLELLINSAAVLTAFCMMIYIAIMLFGSGAMFSSVRWSVIVNALCMFVRPLCSRDSFEAGGISK